MKSFEDFYKDLTSDERWHEQAGKSHKPETFQKVAEQVYTLGLSDRDNFEIQPLREHRNHVVNKLNKILPDKPKGKPWYVVEQEKKEEEKKEEWVPVSPEERQRRLAEFKALIDSMPMINNFPRISRKEEAENSDWMPAKPAPHPITSVREAYVRQRHFAWIQHSFDARTKEPLPTYMEENLFNQLYDEKETAKMEKKVYKTLR